MPSERVAGGAKSANPQTENLARLERKGSSSSSLYKHFDPSGTGADNTHCCKNSRTRTIRVGAKCLGKGRWNLIEWISFLPTPNVLTVS